MDVGAGCDEKIYYLCKVIVIFRYNNVGINQGR